MKKLFQDKKLMEIMKQPVPRSCVGIVHLQMIKESRTLYGMKRFSNPETAVEMMRPLLKLSDREMFLILSLNVRLEPLAVEIAAVGGIDSCCVDIRNIFKHALLSNATCIICFHNHLSGCSDPSMEDRRITDRIKECGKLLGIPLTDHIIIGDADFYSFQEHGPFGSNGSDEAA